MVSGVFMINANVPHFCRLKWMKCLQFEPHRTNGNVEFPTFMWLTHFAKWVRFAENSCVKILERKQCICIRAPMTAANSGEWKSLAPHRDPFAIFSQNMYVKQQLGTNRMHISDADTNWGARENTNIQHNRIRSESGMQLISKFVSGTFVVRASFCCVASSNTK